MPVLSRTTVLILWRVSKAWADLDKIPRLAPLPVPTIIAVGVASPKAQGQEITNTQIPIDKANSKLSPLNSQMIVAIIASVITIGTKIALILSAILAIGALELVASSTKFMIWAKVVFSPILVTRILK